MALHRRAAKRDTVEGEIVDALEKCGWCVLKVSVKNGPDLIAAHKENFDWHRTIAIEVKTGKKKLRPGQSAWFATWPGEKAVLRCADDVLNL